MAKAMISDRAVRAFLRAQFAELHVAPSFDQLPRELQEANIVAARAALQVFLNAWLNNSY